MSRKGENIYKRKDGRWEGRFIKARLCGGKAKYGYVYAKTYREVKSKLAEARITSCKEKITDTDSCDSELFQNIANDWLSYIKPQIKESSYNKYYNLLYSYVIPEFSLIHLSSITHSFLEDYCNRLLLSGGKDCNGLSTKTVADVISVIRSILQYALKLGMSVHCDGRSVNIKQKTNDMRVLSRKEQDKLCQYLYSDLTPANIGILVCLFTGIRVGELCALQWEDISFSEKTVHIRQTMQRIQQESASGKKTTIIITAPKSACSIRTIPLPDELVEVLRQHKDCTTGFFLTNSTCNYIEPRTMQNHFKKALEKSSVEPANYHALRHTFATRCIELGFDVKSLSEILGHATVNITMNRYVHPSMELKKENMKRLSELFTVK